MLLMILFIESSCPKDPGVVSNVYCCSLETSNLEHKLILQKAIGNRFMKY